LLFAANALATLVVTVSVSWLKPMDARQQARADAFRERLRTPIGELDEDRPRAADEAAAVSPFRVVGVSILLIGVMMLAVLPWVTGGLAFYLDLSLGGLLAILGGLMAWRSKALQTVRAGQVRQ
jgi:hypothetical protein